MPEAEEEKKADQQEEEVIGIPTGSYIAQKEDEFLSHSHRGIGTSPIRAVDIIRTLDSGCRVYLGSNQGGIAQNVVTRINFDTEDFDLRSEYDNSTNYCFTVKKDGYYFIHANVHMTCTSADEIYNIYIYKNGSNHSRNTIHSARASNLTLKVTDVIKLARDDYVDIRVMHGVGTNQLAFGNSSDTYLTIFKIF